MLSNIFKTVSGKYIDFLDVFSSDLIAQLSACIIINNHKVEVIIEHQPSYECIYSLRSIKLKT